MIKYEVTNTYVTGVFPDTVADNSTGAATHDGFEFVKAYLDNSNLGPMQAIMDYSAGSQNIPTGSVGVPNGVTESAGASQIVEALHKMTGSGPGTVKPWMKDDNPSVTGDRVLLLSEQGVLIASYPDLDAATWIGGDTAAQVAAVTAGKKFYRSSDAAGLVGDASGPYLQLPPNLQPTFFKQYLGDGTDFTCSGTSWTTQGAVAVPYKTTGGTWRLIFNVDGDVAGGTNALALTVSGVTFKSGYEQGVIFSQQNRLNAQIAFTSPGASVISAQSESATNAIFRLSGDVELDSKPTWADDFEIQWGITY